MRLGLRATFWSLCIYWYRQITANVILQLAMKKRKRDFMQACAESPVVFLNQMLESLNASVQELKRSDLLRLPFAQPLRVGAGCKGHMQQELLPEERLSALWDWPGMEKIALKAMEQPTVQEERRQQQHAANATASEYPAEFNGGAYASHTPAGRREQDVQQPKQKKQKKNGDLSNLDPSQALQNLMTGGPQIHASKANANGMSSAEQHSSAGRRQSNHELQVQQMNGNSGSMNVLPSVVSSLASLQRTAQAMQGGEMPARQQHASHAAHAGAQLHQEQASFQGRLLQERLEQERRNLTEQLQQQQHASNAAHGLQLHQEQASLQERFLQERLDQERRNLTEQLQEQLQQQQQMQQQLIDLQKIKDQLKEKEVQNLQTKLQLDPQFEQQVKGSPQVLKQIMDQIDRTVDLQLQQMLQPQAQPASVAPGSSWAI